MDNILQENDALRTNLAALEQVTPPPPPPDRLLIRLVHLGPTALMFSFVFGKSPRNQENVALITSLRALEQVIALQILPPAGPRRCPPRTQARL